jgi:two-component system chemotaxis response regulator CheV
MSQTNILLEAGTNELEIVEFFIEEPDVSDDGTPKSKAYRGYYGVNVAKVLEISRMPKVTELPEVQHPSVMGAFNLRSHIVPLVDLGLWLGKGHIDGQEPPKVIVTEFNGVTTAFMVSGVNRIHRISWEQVEPPNRYVSMVSKSSITGVVKLEGRIVFLLDLEKIVADLNPALGLRLDEAVDWGSEMSYRALVADDSGLIREMLKDLLQKANFQVEAVHNGHEAWDRLLELKAKAETEGRHLTDYVQAVISDIEMPSMDGHSLCRHVKEDSMMRNLPVVLFSSLITDKLRHKGESVGADDQISKPEVTTLARRVYALIAERKQAGVM